MNKKRIIASTLVAALAMPTSAFAAKPTDFTDFPNDWSRVALEHALDNDLLVGDNGKINAQGTLTRAQMAVIMTRAFGAKDTTSIAHFEDVNPNAWYYEDLSRAVEMGALKGTDAKSIRPEAPITREEAFSVLSRLFETENGDVSVLNKFGDHADVSDWAKSGLAAMVQAGYVAGNDGNLNPQDYITRAEFAAIMDRIVALYVDQGTKVPETVNGNVILREAGASLDGTTVKGNLVIADAVDNANLKGVTVTDKIIMRGGKGEASFDQVSADSVVLDDGSSLKELNLKDSNVKDLTVDSSNITVNSNKTIDDVAVNGSNVKINVPEANVTTGPNAQNVENNGKPVAPGGEAVVPPISGGNGGGSVTPGPVDPEQREYKLIETARFVQLGDLAQYVVVQFKEGNTLNNCTLKLDGKTVTPSNVTDDGSVVKIPVTRGNADLTVAKAGVEDNLVVRSGQSGKAVALTEQELPDFFMLNGPVYVWDYHLTNYDADGNVRVEPAKTTMSLEQQAPKQPFFSPDAIVYEDEKALPYFVKGEAQLMFNYKTAAEKDFVDGITDVDLVSYSEYKNTLNEELIYTLDTAFPHGAGTVACIKVPIGQENFTANGRYYLRVTSNGKADLYPIHLVQEKVPSMEVTGNTGYSQKEVHFRLSDMTYGITRPIYRVDLTNSKGETHTLKFIDDWFLHGDLLVLYNEQTNYFPETGDYKVTVYADGFQPFEKTFHQEAFPDGIIVDRDVAEADMIPAAMSVDAISTASVGGGGSSGGGGGESGDTKVMNANLIIDSDLLINAEAVMALGLKDSAAEGIAKRWENMQTLYAFNEGAEDLYDYVSYYDAANAAATRGETLTFADYITSENAKTTPNRPYAVKQVLEDNLLGETTSFRELIGITTPELVLESQSETSAVFSCTDKEYLAQLAQFGDIYLNNNGLPLRKPAVEEPEVIQEAPAADYVVNAEAGTITLNKVEIGNNSMKVVVPGYQSNLVNFEINKVMEEVVLSAPQDYKAGTKLNITCGEETHECDFFKHIKTVKVTGPNGYTREVQLKGNESVFEKIGYTVKDNVLTLEEDVLTQEGFLGEDGNFVPGEYKVSIHAQYYGTKEITVNVGASESTNPEAGLDVPELKNVTGPTSIFDGDYDFTFAKGSSAYIAAINAVKVNDLAIAGYNTDNVVLKILQQNIVKGQTNTVEISAEGYKTLKVELTVDEKGTVTEFKVEQVGGGEVAPELADAVAVENIEEDITGPGITMYFAEPNGAGIDYSNAVKEVSLNGVALERLQFSASAGAIGFEDTTGMNKGETPNTVVIKAEGYKDQTVTFYLSEEGVPSLTKPGTNPEAPDTGVLKKVPVATDFHFVKDMFRGDHYAIDFSIPGADKEVMAVDAVTAATGGSGGGGSVPPVIPPLPEPTPEEKAVYEYVSSLKTYMNETKDSSITVDGKEITESKNETLDNENSFLVIADEHEMARNKVVFNRDVFDNKKNVEVVIKVAGYEDLKLTVSGETVEVAPNPDPEAPLENQSAPIVIDMTTNSHNDFVVHLKDAQGTVEDSAYKFLRALTTVTVNGTPLQAADPFKLTGIDEGEYGINASAQEFIFDPATVGNGTGNFTFTLTADGFKPLTIEVKNGQVTVVPEKPDVQEGLAAPVTKGELVHDVPFYGDSTYKMKFANPEGVVDGQYVYNFLRGLTSVTVNDVVYTEKSGFGSMGDTQYKLNASSGELAFTENALGKGTGEFTVKLTSEGYKTMTILVKDGKYAEVQPEPEKPQVTLAAPVAGEIVFSEYLDYADIKFVAPKNPVNDHVYNFLAKLETVTVNGEPLSRGNISGFPDQGQFNTNATGETFRVAKADIGNGTGTFTFVLTAPGYETMTFTVVDGQIGQVTPEPEAPALNATPVATGVTHNPPSFKAGNYTVKFGNPEGVTDEDYVYTFLRGLTSVKVNDVVFEEQKSYGAIGDNEYDLNANEKTIAFSENALGNGSGEFVIELTAEGYEVMTFKVINGTEVQMIEKDQLKTAPEADQMVYQSGFGGSYFNISFTGEDSEIEAYLNASTEISVSGNKLKKVASFFNDTLSYKFANDPSFGGAYKFLDITADSFPEGSSDLVIKAEGYEDLTIHVSRNGNNLLITTPIE